MRGVLSRATAAASTLTGKRFGLLAASSLVATSAIVAAAATTGSGGIGPLAALIGRSLAADSAPAESPAPEPAAGPGGATPAAPAPHRAPRPSAPAPQPAAVPARSPAPAPQETEKSSEPPAPAPEPGPAGHVFVVSMVSPGYEAAFGPSSEMPYLSGDLRAKGELLPNYSLLDEGSLPNEIAAVSGQRPGPKTRQGCPSFDECVFPVETTTIADQLTVGGLGWRAYMEGMAGEGGTPENCVHPDAGEPYPAAEGGYTATRNPFAYFHSLLDLGDCSLNDVPLTELAGDLRKADSTPALTYVAPTLCDAGAVEECPEGTPGRGAAAADAFLAEWAPKILSSPAYRKDGMLIVVFDRLDPTPPVEGTPAPAEASKKVGALLVSPLVSPGSSDPSEYGPYSLLRSIEDALGLSHLGAAGGAKVRSFTASLGEGGGGD
jgi:hypothetical protein